MDKCDSQKQVEAAGDGDMRLGRLEFAAMNNPIRRWMQKHIEFRIFRKQLQKRGIHLEDGVIMDAECGSGEQESSFWAVDPCSAGGGSSISQG